MNIDKRLSYASSSIIQDMWHQGRDLCYQSEKNYEYVRGIAELLIDSTFGFSQDSDRDDVMDWLVTSPYKTQRITLDVTYLPEPGVGEPYQWDWTDITGDNVSVIEWSPV